MKEPKESFVDQLFTWFKWGSFIASAGWVVLLIIEAFTHWLKSS
ncbi:hypothetical protein OAM03_01830 [Verrucomicrobia bacterium]|nr:hypothetical protein [Verrucomicrobiota bacterium]